MLNVGRHISTAESVDGLFGVTHCDERTVIVTIIFGIKCGRE